MTARYALLCYSTGNLGDEVQSLAARRFLPSVDVLWDRDHLHTVPGAIAGKFKLIMNGWYIHRPEHWPPSDAIIPLITSFHLTDMMWNLNINRIPPDTILQGRGLDYFRAHAPIGARDLWTCEQLDRHGIDAYFSACLSPTLDYPRDLNAPEYGCLNEVPSEVRAFVHARTRTNVVITSHNDGTTTGAW